MPKTEQELDLALQSGHLQESHFVDFKEALPEGKSGNKSIAKDLASFSIDGGHLIVGVAESADGFILKPISLSNQSERVEQIALSLVEPPVFIRTDFIPSVLHPGRGYLIINVPASDFAPHMVEDRYMARSDKTQRTLSHTEVFRFHESRAKSSERLSQEIKKQIARDPIPPDIRTFPHLHITATPRLATSPLFLEILRDDNCFNRLRDLLKLAAERTPLTKSSSRNHLVTVVTSFALRHDGVALYSGNIHKNRAFKDPGARHPEGITEIEFSQEGQIRFFNGQVGYRNIENGAEGSPGIEPQWIVEQARELLELVAIASRSVNFGGRWDFSLAITGISGLRVFRGTDRWFDDFRYESNSEDYVCHASADLFQLDRDSGEVLEILLGRFIRSIGMEKHFRPFFAK
jgi:hypothetical protein